MLQSVELQRLRHDLATKQQQFPFFTLCWKNTDFTYIL